MNLYSLVFLACPIGMGLMMWMMMRGGTQAPSRDQTQEIDELRAQVESLRSEQKTHQETNPVP